MSLDWRALAIARLKSPLALLFAVAFLAAGAMTVGGALVGQAGRLSAEIPEVAAYYVLVRAADVEEARGLVDAVSGARVVGERRAGEILAELGAPEAGPDHIAVLEVQTRLSGEAGDVAALAGQGVVVDVIDLNARARGEVTRALVGRRLSVGVGLLVVGCAVFVAAVVLCAQLVGRESREEIGVRVLLGAEAEGLWGPLGLLVGGVALAGALLAFAATAVVVPSLAIGDAPAVALPGAWTALGALALLAGTFGLALGSARRAVARAARATVLAGLAAALAFAPPTAALADPSREVQDGPARDADILRALSRDLAICRRARHVAKKGLAATERQTLAAAASDDWVRLRIAAAKRAEEVAVLGDWEERCGALAAERDRVREVLRSARLFGPPIAPRHAPVKGSVAVRYGDAGTRPGTAGFRNGVALRTRAGESIHASAGGRVAYSGDLPGSGPVVVVDHGRRTYSVYAKIDRSLVSVGEEVVAGQTVARARAGLLYFSIRHRGRAVDPLVWVASAPKG